MIELEEIELHDALLKRFEIDYVARSAKLALEYYANADDAKRQSLVVTFEGIASLSKISNLSQLEKNAFAGNINYWHPEQGGTTYIYLTGGCLEINAERVTAMLSL